MSNPMEGKRYIASNPNEERRPVWHMPGSTEEIPEEKANELYTAWCAANPSPAWPSAVRYDDPEWAAYRAACTARNNKHKAECPQVTYEKTGKITWHGFGTKGKVVSLYDSVIKAQRYGKRVYEIDLALLPQVGYDDPQKEYEDMERLAETYMRRADEARARCFARDNA